MGYGTTILDRFGHKVHSTKVQTRDTSGACEIHIHSYCEHNKPKHECIKCCLVFLGISAVAALYTKGGDYIQKSADIKTACSFLDVIYWLHRIVQSIVFMVILFKQSVEGLQSCLHILSLASRRAFLYLKENNRESLHDYVYQKTAVLSSL